MKVRWNSFVNAEVNEIADHLGANDPLAPYGNGQTANSPIIALGESWAYHIGHFFTSQKYGTQSGWFREQGEWYSNNNPVAGLNSNLNLLEDFSPDRTNDVFRWIPQGLFYDMIDERNDREVTNSILHPDDKVFNYTNQQFFNALDNDINSLPEFRLRLLTENGNNQSTNVISLFEFYHN